MEHRKLEIATSDYRGFIADIFYKEKIDHVAFVRTDKGKVIRGNHYHKQTTQHILMVKGSLRYHWGVMPRTDYPVYVGALHLDVNEMVTTPPLEIHALEFLEPADFIVFSSGLRGGQDYEADTFREHKILARPDWVSR